MNEDNLVESHHVAPRLIELRDGVPTWTLASPPRHVHVVPSLSLGGAERIVAELSCAFGRTGIEADIVVMRESGNEHPLDVQGVRIHRPGLMPSQVQLPFVAGLILGTRLPAFCHLTSISELRRLWHFGVSTVPVVHNVREGWTQDIAAWDNNPLVPFVVACGDKVAADLVAAGVTCPVRVLRHVAGVPEWLDKDARHAVRSAMGAGDNTLLLGMTGRIVVQKRYTRAVRILASLRRKGVDARLVIIGASTGDEGQRCRTALIQEAANVGMTKHLVLAGPVPDAARLVSAYDVHLNTSLWEGVSVSTMEAVTAGVPVVTADVGGQREATGDLDTLMAENATDDEWAAAVILSASARDGNEQGVRQARQARQARDEITRVRQDAMASLWPWTLALGPGSRLPATGSAPSCDLMFVTGNIDMGGAQRSLCNLAAALPGRGVRVVVAVAGRIGERGFVNHAIDAGAEFIDVSGGPRYPGALQGRMGRILSLVLARRPRTLCFWNMDAATKFAVVKAMQGGSVHLADVSPGPMLYEEMDAEGDAARYLSTSVDEYMRALDLLVSKYEGGGPSPGRPHPRQVVVIPNGVPVPTDTHPEAREAPCTPKGYPAELAVVTVGRMVAAKRPRLLPLVARSLGKILPGATLTVVTGIQGPLAQDAWDDMLTSTGGVLPDNLFFRDADDRTTLFLPRFSCFYMVSLSQGCPNASLEAMMSCLPVVANPDGGTAEQVEHGVTGLLVLDPGDEKEYAQALARAIADVLSVPGRAREMGMAGRKKACQRFSMDAMAEAYHRVLLPTA